MEKIIRVNMRTLEAREEAVPSGYARFGGRGVTSKIIADEVEPTCSPTGRHNKLVIAPGLLGGTMLSSSGRVSIGAKSPLTGRIKESNSGGTAGRKLANLGIKALVVEDKPVTDDCYVIRISAEKVEIVKRNDLKKQGNYKTAAELYDELKPAVISVGQSGEMKMSAAGISVTDLRGEPNNIAARGGLGAVMGSKGVKAVVIDDSGAEGVSISSEESFKKSARIFNKSLVDNPGKQAQAKYGTASITAVVNDMGALPTNNFRRGDFKEIHNIDGSRLYELITERGGEGRTTFSCMPGCVIRCRNTFADVNGKRIASCVQYETLGLLGSNCGIGNLDYIARLTHLCNDIGVDTIEMGATIAMLNDAGMYEFGDGDRAVELLEEISRGTVLGRVLGQGAQIAARVLGIDRVPAVKGQAMPSYDPRSLKGNGVTYSTSPMGADHTAGNAFGARKVVDPLLCKNQAELSRDLQIKVAAVVDNTGLCLFARPPVINDFNFLVSLLNDRFGWDLIPEDITQIGKDIISTEIDFNRRAGFNEYSYALPEFLRDEELPPHNTVFNVPAEELRQVHNF